MRGSVQKELCSKGRSGGVSLYIKEDILFEERNVLNTNNISFESLFLELDSTENHSNKIIIGVVYKPPDVPVDSYLESLNIVNEEPKEIYIMRDFNIDLLSAKKQKPTSNLIDPFLSYSYLSLINRPTRMTSTSVTLIDNIFCNNVYNNSYVNCILFTDISDHLPIFCIKNFF